MVDILHLDLSAARKMHSDLNKAIQDIYQNWDSLARQINHLTEADWQGPAAKEFSALFNEIYAKEKQQLNEFERLRDALKREIDQWEDNDLTFVF